MSEKTGHYVAPSQDRPEAGKNYGCDLPQDEALTRDGWEWRGNTDATRQRELVDMYEEVGFEVRLEPLDTEAMCSACGGCKGAFSQFHAIYVRKRG